MTKFENPNFSTEILEVINSFQPLAEWFKKNQFDITYFGFNNATYQFDKKNDYHLHPEMEVLRQMMGACLLWLKTKYKYTNGEKALKAAVAISEIYNMNIKELSASARESYHIDVRNINPEFVSDALTPPDLLDLEEEYLIQKQQSLMHELHSVEERLLEIQKRKTSSKA